MRTSKRLFGLALTALLGFGGCEAPKQQGRSGGTSSKADDARTIGAAILVVQDPVHLYAIDSKVISRKARAGDIYRGEMPAGPHQLTVWYERRDRDRSRDEVRFSVERSAPNLLTFVAQPRRVYNVKYEVSESPAQPTRGKIRLTIETMPAGGAARSP